MNKRIALAVAVLLLAYTVAASLAVLYAKYPPFTHLINSLFGGY